MYKSVRAMIIFAVLASSLGACLSAAPQTEVPQAQNTQSLQDAQSQINTAVAQTIEAQNQVGTFVAQTVEAQATPTVTVTPFSIPTFTPFVIPTATAYSGGGGGGSGGTGNNNGNGGPGAPKFDCSLVNQKPYDGDRIYKPGDSFDVTWTLKNVGTKPIPADAYFTYIGGDALSPTPGFALGYEVAKQKTFSVTIEITAPQVQGTEKQQFTTQWALIANGDKICKPYIAIFVQKQ